MYEIYSEQVEGFYEYVYKAKNEFRQTLEITFYLPLDDNSWNVQFYIANKRKHGFKHLEQIGKDGIKSLLWAKSCIKDFIEFLSQSKIYKHYKSIKIEADDKRRLNIYEYGLKDLGFKKINKNQLMLKLNNN